MALLVNWVKGGQMLRIWLSKKGFSPKVILLANLGEGDEVAR